MSVRTLFERQLEREAKRITRKGLSRVYAEQIEQTSAVRGRVLVRENLGIPKATLFCRFSELSYDTPENRILRHAISNLGRSDTTRRILVHLAQVPAVQLARTNWIRPKWHRLNRHYKRGVDAARLLTVGVSPTIRLRRKPTIEAAHTTIIEPPTYPDTGESGETYDVEART